MLSLMLYYRYIVLACDSRYAKTLRSPNINVVLAVQAQRQRGNRFFGVNFAHRIAFVFYCNTSMSKKGYLDALIRQLTS